MYGDPNSLMLILHILRAFNWSTFKLKYRYFHLLLSKSMSKGNRDADDILKKKKIF